MNTKNLHQQYLGRELEAARFQRSVKEQIEHLISANSIPLGVPLETRIKDWKSISEKIERKSLNIENIHELDDLVGIRLILLFRNDVETVCRLLEDNFRIVSKEETGERLGETQFGYQSTHYVISIPDTWRQIPTLKGLEDFKCEIQVRSLAQHIWAAASHKLQYKREVSVPPPLRRTINRISALLEIVDLEFDRVLSDRETYVTETVEAPVANEPLNVDVIKTVLDEIFPSANKEGDEDYDRLLEDLTHFKILTRDDLRKLIEGHLEGVLQREASSVAERKKSKDYTGTSQNRTESGLFYNFLGLARAALRLKFGEKTVDNYMIGKAIRRPKGKLKKKLEKPN